jgi:hypothetical protein
LLLLCKQDEGNEDKDKKGLSTIREEEGEEEERRPFSRR